jgi:hypothetical protein
LVESHIEGFRRDPSHLARHIAESGSGSAVIVVDQFEELLILCDDPTSRVAFVRNLLTLANGPENRHTVILTMRSDAFTDIARFPDLLSVWERIQILVTPLDAPSLREAVEKPAQLVGLKFEEGLLDALLNDLLGERDSAAPRLAIRNSVSSSLRSRCRSASSSKIPPHNAPGSLSVALHCSAAAERRSRWLIAVR